jgi:3'(2'), 5'-bisphosphate nucleotidase
MSPSLKAVIDSMKPDEVLSVGGAGHKVLMVIEGIADAYVYPSAGCKKWDTCAPEAVLRERGGVLTDIFGNDILYDKDVQHLNSLGVLATKDQKTQDKCVALIPQEVKEKLVKAASCL